jgi:uncharacterized damage-inducible protein DinB
VFVLDQLLEAWRINNRINLYLIDHISAAGMKCTLSKRSGRDVARQFGHIHNNRVWHLEKRAKDLAQGLVKFETKVTPSKAELEAALTASGEAMESFLEAVFSGAPKRRGLKKGVFATFGYHIAHESHHRGNILLTLKECGHGLDKNVQYAIWGWDQM